MNWYLKVIRDNYFNFEGRARRTEYWMFNLMHICIIFLLAILTGLLSDSSSSAGNLPIILVLIYILATFIPSLAVTVRRLHDTGKSGWYYLFSFIPYVGGIILIVFTVMDGDTGPNKYGPDPKKPDYLEIEEIGQPQED